MSDKPNDSKPKTAKELQAAYDALVRQAGGFDRQTTGILRERDAETKQIVEGRKKERAELLAKKLAAFKALGAVKAAPAKEEAKPKDAPQEGQATA